MPRVTAVLETCLYVDDLARAAQFYERLFGFPRLDSDNRFCAFDVGGRDVLILFLRGATREAVRLAGGSIPPHDGAGPLHLALSIPAGELGAWEERLRSAGVAIESRVKWPMGGQSLYFRDPDQNLVELVTDGTWSIY